MSSRLPSNQCPMKGKHRTPMHRDACPVCNPEKTVPELQAASAEHLPSKERFRNQIGCFMVENDMNADNLAVVLCTYFEGHLDRPKPDPHTENGWGAWAEQQANRVLDDLAAFVAERLPSPPADAQRIADLEHALVYCAFHQHGTPQYMLPPRITLIDSDTVEVRFTNDRRGPKVIATWPPRAAVTKEGGQ